MQQPGDVLLKFGGAGDILLSSRKARPDPRLFLDYHLVPGLFMPNGCMAASGSLLNWFAANFGHAADGRGSGNRLQRLDALGRRGRRRQRRRARLPYFLGEKTPIHDPLARGTFTGLGLHHGPQHLWRACSRRSPSACATTSRCSTRWAMPATRVLASDGGSASRLWMQIVADVLGQPVQRLSGHPGSCLGAAWMAAMGTGLADDWNGVSAFVSRDTPVEPVAAHRAVYDAAYEDYRELYAALRPLFHKHGGAA